MKHPLQIMIERRQAGEKCGIPSYCTANELALEPRALALYGVIRFMADYEYATL